MKDGSENGGGQLELWNRDVSECIHSVDPIFNRCACLRRVKAAFMESLASRALQVLFAARSRGTTTPRPLHLIGRVNRTRPFSKLAQGSPSRAARWKWCKPRPLRKESLRRSFADRLFSLTLASPQGLVSLGIGVMVGSRACLPCWRMGLQTPKCQMMRFSGSLRGEAWRWTSAGHHHSGRRVVRP
jgi:hypothetical protein